jgi:hypothetical protein
MIGHSHDNRNRLEKKTKVRLTIKQEPPNLYRMILTAELSESLLAEGVKLIFKPVFYKKKSEPTKST